jgi:di/tricarboxylate transporter
MIYLNFDKCYYVVIIIIAMMVAVGIEVTGLHERIALMIILLFGSNPLW